MNYKNKTKDELIKELQKLQQEFDSLQKTFANDITERKKAEEALQESEIKLKTLFEVLPIGVSILDQERKAVLVNPVMERILKMTKDGFNRGDYKSRKYFRPDGTQMHKEEFASVLATREQRAVHDFETGVLMEDGHVYWVNVTAAPVAFKDWNVVIIISDITERKQAEKKLMLLQKAIDTSGEIIFMTDREGIITFVNPAFTSTYGYTADEVVGKVTPRILKSGTIAEDIYKKIWNDLLSGQELKNEYKNKRKDGNLIDIDGSANAIFDENRNIIGFLAIQRDISKRKLAEIELKESEARLQKIFEILPIGLWFADKNGKLIRGNSAGVKIWGAEPLVPLEELGVFKARRLPSGQEIAPDDWALFHTIRKGVTVTNEMLEIDAFDGTRKIILNYTAPVLDEKGQLQGAIVVNNDITERKLAEEELLKSEERLRNITEQVTDVIFITNKRGHITYISPSAKSVFGYSQGEMISMPFLKFLAKSEAPKAMAEFNLSIKLNQKRENLILLMKHKDGSTFNGELTYNAFYENGLRTGVVGVIRNITERLQAEEEIRKSKKLLEDLYTHLNEIRENERALISRIIHDELGQSMTALKLDLNRMQKYVSANPEAVTKLQGMIELVSNTIKDVQRISSDLRPGILDELGLVSAIEWYCDEFETRTGIKCNLKLDDSDFGDSQINLTFFRVLQETLTNIIRHASASSVSIKLHQLNKGITMTIKDNGIGITKEQIESNRSLGLIGMRERVRQFNGTIDISSKKGNGTQLTIFIPSK